MAGELVGRKVDGQPLSSLSALRGFIHDREIAFMTGLLQARSTNTNNQGDGWEIIETRPSGFVIKHSGNKAVMASKDRRKDEAIFTGKGLCDSVAVFMYEALRTHIDETAIELAIGNIGTDMNRENWERPDNLISSPIGNHTILRATYKITGEVIYIDPTYGQVDHRFRNKILIINGEDYRSYYKTGRQQDGEIEFDKFDQDDLAILSQPSTTFSSEEIASLTSFWQ